MSRILDASQYYNRATSIAERRRKTFGGYEPVADVIVGVVFSIGGSIYPSGRGTEYVYVHEHGAYASQEQAYKPPHVDVWDGAGVLLMRSPKIPYELEIIRTYHGPYPRAVLGNTPVSRGSVGPHAANHQYPSEGTKGNDAVLIWNAAIQVLKGVTSGTDLTVTVGPTVYGVGGTRKWFPSATIDLTSYMPSAGNAKRVLIYLDTSTNGLGVEQSAEVAIGVTPAFPSTPSFGIASSYWYLQDGYTSLSQRDDYRDARQFLTEAASLPLATGQNQQLFADANLVWTPGKIVTSAGDVVVSGGDVVWSR